MNGEAQDVKIVRRPLMQSASLDQDLIFRIYKSLSQSSDSDRENSNAAIYKAVNLNSKEIVSQLNKERRLNLSLIHEILPPKVADDLRAGRPALAEPFSGVTIFFSDVVGFTEICSKVTPIEVVKLLNELYTVMDYCTSLFPLYKVETIGDAYLVAGGLPDVDDRHAHYIADFALLVQSAVQAVKSPIDGAPLQIRMGIHSGPVVAGVVGILMPRYCLFGDTVHIANRMEANSIGSSILCTKETYDLLKGSNNHIFRPGGVIEENDLPPVETYWLIGATDSNENANSTAVQRTMDMVNNLLMSSDFNYLPFYDDFDDADDLDEDSDDDFGRSFSGTYPMRSQSHDSLTAIDLQIIEENGDSSHIPFSSREAVSFLSSVDEGDISPMMTSRTDYSRPLSRSFRSQSLGIISIKGNLALEPDHWSELITFRRPSKIPKSNSLDNENIVMEHSHSNESFDDTDHALTRENIEKLNSSSTVGEEILPPIGEERSVSSSNRLTNDSARNQLQIDDAADSISPVPSNNSCKSGSGAQTPPSKSTNGYSVESGSGHRRNPTQIVALHSPPKRNSVDRDSRNGYSTDSKKARGDRSSNISRHSSRNRFSPSGSRSPVNRSSNRVSPTGRLSPASFDGEGFSIDGCISKGMHSPFPSVENIAYPTDTKLATENNSPAGNFRNGASSTAGESTKSSETASSGKKLVRKLTTLHLDIKKADINAAAPLAPPPSHTDINFSGSKSAENSPQKQANAELRRNNSLQKFNQAELEATIASKLLSTPRDSLGNSGHSTARDTRVLVVEDSASMRKALIDKLKLVDPSWVISTADHGEDALRKIKASQNHVDLIFVNQKLSEDGLSGTDVIDIARNTLNMHECVMIAYVERITAINKEAFKKAGIDDIWSPPLPEIEVMREIIGKLGKLRYNLLVESSLLPNRSSSFSSKVSTAGNSRHNSFILGLNDGPAIILSRANSRGSSRGNSKLPTPRGSRQNSFRVQSGSGTPSSTTIPGSSAVSSVNHSGAISHSSSSRSLKAGVNGSNNSSGNNLKYLLQTGNRAQLELMTCSDSGNFSINAISSAGSSENSSFYNLTRNVSLALNEKCSPASPTARDLASNNGISKPNSQSGTIFSPSSNEKMDGTVLEAIVEEGGPKLEVVTNKSHSRTQSEIAEQLYIRSNDSSDSGTSTHPKAVLFSSNNIDLFADVTYLQSTISSLNSSFTFNDHQKTSKDNDSPTGPYVDIPRLSRQGSKNASFNFNRDVISKDGSPVSTARFITKQSGVYGDTIADTSPSIPGHSDKSLMSGSINTAYQTPAHLNAMPNGYPVLKSATSFILEKIAEVDSPTGSLDVSQPTPSKTSRRRSVSATSSISDKLLRVGNSSSSLSTTTSPEHVGLTPVPGKVAAAVASINNGTLNRRVTESTSEKILKTLNANKKAVHNSSHISVANASRTSSLQSMGSMNSMIGSTVSANTAANTNSSSISHSSSFFGTFSSSKTAPPSGVSGKATGVFQLFQEIDELEGVESTSEKSIQSVREIITSPSKFGSYDFSVKNSVSSSSRIPSSQAFHMFDMLSEKVHDDIETRSEKRLKKTVSDNSMVVSPDSGNVIHIVNGSTKALAVDDHDPVFVRSPAGIRRRRSKARSQQLKLDLIYQLDRERMLNLSLIHQMLPPKVAEDLLFGRPVLPEPFENSTVFFSNIIGFRKLSAKCAPMKVIQLLNKLYIVMDYCVSLFPQLYKVETIGDVYMVVGGLPEPDERHAQSIADFAILVQAAVRAVTSPFDDSPLQIRMGIHSGPVVAGVVGNLMPRYCLFGDTVNTSSRMNSNSDSGRILISRATYDLLAQTDDFEIEERGVIDVKGKGRMQTFWLLAGAQSNNNSNYFACEKVLEVANNVLLKSNLMLPTYEQFNIHSTLGNPSRSPPRSPNRSPFASNNNSAYDLNKQLKAELNAAVISPTLSNGSGDSGNSFGATLAKKVKKLTRFTLSNDSNSSSKGQKLRNGSDDSIDAASVILPLANNQSVTIMTPSDASLYNYLSPLKPEVVSKHMTAKMIPHNNSSNNSNPTGRTASPPPLNAGRALKEDSIGKMNQTLVMNKQISTGKSIPVVDSLARVAVKDPSFKYRFQVLIVEDSAAQRKSMMRQLKMADSGWVLSFAEHGEAALERLNEMKYRCDVMFIDQNLSRDGMLGSSFVEKIRNEFNMRGTIIIGCVSQVPVNTQMFLQAGADEVWVKPLPRPDIIKRNIDMLVASRSSVFTCGC